MHTMLKFNSGAYPYEVGYWIPDRKGGSDWIMISKGLTKLAALRLVNFLNGGTDNDELLGIVGKLIND